MCSWYSKMVIDERNQEKSDANMKPGSKVKRRSFHIFVKDFPSKCWRSTTPCKGKMVEKPKTRNRSRGHPDNKLLGEKATWGQRLQQSTNGRSFAERFYKSTTRRHEQGRLLPRGFAQGSNGTAPPPRLPGGNILKSFPSVGYQEDPIFMRLFHYREDSKTRWWRPLPTWRRGKLFGGKQLLRQSQSDLEILRRGGQ